MRIRFYNGKLCTMEGDIPTVTGDELWTRGDKVDYIGPVKQSGEPFDREIDLRGNLVMPGFKNAHTHSAMTFLRSYADDMPLLDWLHKQVFPMEAKLTPDLVYHLSKLAIMEYLTSGITANFDMYFYNEKNAQASIDCGFRTMLCGAVTGSDEGGVEKAEREFNLFNNGYHPLIGYQIGFHAEYTSNPGLLKGISALAEKYGAPVWCHNSESRSEVDGCLARHGVTPTVYLDGYGLWNHGGGGFHCIHLTSGDMEIMRKRGLWAVTNPGSNCKLASGIAPLTDLDRCGVGLAIGTDGPASNNGLDFFREMYLCTVMQKLRNDDASAMDAHKVLWMATVGGARAMGLTECDSLVPGKQADLIVIDLMQPNMQPVNNLTKNLVYSGSKQNVKMTMVAGTVLYEDGRFHIGVDPHEVYARANEIIHSMR